MNDIKTLIDILAEQSGNFPNRVAAVCGDSSLTYRQLNEFSDIGARQLMSLGVKKGDLVGIGYDHNEKVILSVFCILKAGGLFVPVNPTFPENRKIAICKDAGIEFVLGEDGLSDLSGTYTLSANFVTNHGEKQDSVQEISLPKITSDDAMAVMYTSGSTGNPKGVVLLHKNPLTGAADYNRIMNIEPGSNIANYASLSFIASINDITAAITTGSTLHYIPNSMLLDISAVANYFEKNNIVSALIPFSFGRKLAEFAELTTIKTLGLCGEPFSPLKPKKYDVVNVYGTTEICGGKFLGPNEIYSLGNVTGKVEYGELVVFGDCVAKGYLHGEVFGGKYCTGDIANLQDKNTKKSGGFIISGRTDFQVKIRGYRIEPYEIDRRLLQVQGVEECVTVKRSERLVTFFVGESDVDVRNLKEILSAELPKYMIPGSFVRLEKLPKTVSGKIDRNALPDVTRQALSTEKPTTDTEKILLGIWSDVLGIKSDFIGVSDKIEDIGGDSLRLIILGIDIEKKFGVTVTPNDLLKAKTISQQAKHIELGKTRRVYMFNADFSGEPLWFAHTANSGSEVYRKFAKRLSSPFYVFENYNMLFSDGKFENISQLAERYLNLLLNYSSECSANSRFYRLGGWSFGGLIAFEMALILQERNIPSELYLIDPIIGQTSKQTDYNAYLRSDPLFERFRDMGLIHKLEENNEFVLQQVLQYRPCGVYQGKAVLFQMTADGEIAGHKEQRLDGEIADDNGFSPYCKNLQVIKIDDTHDNCLSNPKSIDTIVRGIETVT
ncbi:MAG: AMP-binding protein [Ruminococcus sp.]|jgi:acyl-coenzyme A synthetase/AMP-(fatty) acid ligase/thioesterase domain-containing protein/acyl carrier protein|nr:AMP-binding protein [Ruminococcus sp.]